MSDYAYEDEKEATMTSSLTTFFSSPVNIGLTLLCAYLIYKLLKKTTSSDDGPSAPLFKPPPPLPKHDMTLEELRQYNGKGEDGRICISINNRVFDCSKGYRFYGPEGPYAPLAGHDATRALALFDVEAVKDEWDDVSDLTASQLSSVNEWELQFNERYDFVGKLVKERDTTGGDADDDEPSKDSTDK